MWRIWRTKNEVYVAASEMGEIEKLSFHSGGICRKAFTSERGAPQGLSDRATHKWRRSETPPVGNNQGSCVLEVGIPTDYLSTALAPLDKPAYWIQAAPAHMATVLEMFFTLESEYIVRTLTSRVNTLVHVYTQLPNGEAFVVTSRHATFSGESFVVPASHDQNLDYIVSNPDPDQTGRSARITIYANPKDGDRLTVWEYGAYRAAPNSIVGLDGFGTFRRTTVFDRSTKED
jgi:hypothetical protein